MLCRAATVDGSPLGDAFDTLTRAREKQREGDGLCVAVGELGVRGIGVEVTSPVGGEVM